MKRSIFEAFLCFSGVNLNLCKARNNQFKVLYRAFACRILEVLQRGNEGFAEFSFKNFSTEILKTKSASLSPTHQVKQFINTFINLHRRLTAELQKSRYNLQSAMHKSHNISLVRWQSLRLVCFLLFSNNKCLLNSFFLLTPIKSIMQIKKIKA